jgi:hypothetical protein
LTVGTPFGNSTSPMTDRSFLVEMNISEGGRDQVLWTGTPAGCASASASWNETCTITAHGTCHVRASVAGRNAVSARTEIIGFTATYTPPPSGGNPDRQQCPAHRRRAQVGLGHHRRGGRGGPGRRPGAPAAPLFGIAAGGAGAPRPAGRRGVLCGRKRFGLRLTSTWSGSLPDGRPSGRPGTG